MQIQISELDAIVAASDAYTAAMESGLMKAMALIPQGSDELLLCAC